MRHLPNIICLLRIALIWPILLSLQSGAYERTLWLFALAAASDGLDGYLAKRFGWTSQLGALLDPAADKLLLVSVFLLATWLGLIPLWLATVAVGRDVMIALGAVVYRLGWGPLRQRPILASKINTVVQLGYVLAVVVRAAYGVPPDRVIDALAILTAVTVLISGYGYVREIAQRGLRLAA
ncbi:MAG TPA: CDP-alcohol phosphatidyltransferase family protein [Steroidobacteraceae bacterium]|nr:CDP-alcohol phosphatidyltransferase family protein [Steroidobacteraceae bacterium]